LSSYFVCCDQCDSRIVVKDAVVLVVYTSRNERMRALLGHK
jgi:hypothetical protein